MKLNPKNGRSFKQNIGDSRINTQFKALFMNDVRSEGMYRWSG